MVAVDHRFALSMPALVSAPAKKSFSKASCPIFACSSFRSIVGATADSAPNTLAARSSNWFFQSTIWLACTSCNLASSASVFSPLMASTATLALKSGEWFLRGLLLIVIPAFSGLRPGLITQSVHLSLCSDFRRHLYHLDWRTQAGTLQRPSLPRLARATRTSPARQ